MLKELLRLEWRNSVDSIKSKKKKKKEGVRGNSKRNSGLYFSRFSTTLKGEFAPSTMIPVYENVVMKAILFIILCYVFVCAYMSQCAAQCVHTGTKIIAGYEQTDVGAGNPSWVLWRSSNHSWLLSCCYSSAPIIISKKKLKLKSIKG